MRKKRFVEKTTKSYNPAPIEHHISLSSVLYWSTILFMTLMNFLVAVILVPFFIMASSVELYLTVAIFGLLFGQIFNILITRIEHLERHHHLFASVFIPLIAIIALLTVLSLAQKTSDALGIVQAQNPRITILVYIAAFITPNTIARLLAAAKQ
jgi:hypothetical protein